MSEWTNTPPTEPGWYWWRKNCFFPAAPVRLDRQMNENRLQGCNESEWWTTKIEEPK